MPAYKEQNDIGGTSKTTKPVHATEVMKFNWWKFKHTLQVSELNTQNDKEKIYWRKRVKWKPATVVMLINEGKKNKTAYLKQRRRRRKPYQIDRM